MWQSIQPVFNPYPSSENSFRTEALYLWRMWQSLYMVFAPFQTSKDSSERSLMKVEYVAKPTVHNSYQIYVKLQKCEKYDKVFNLALALFNIGDYMMNRSNLKNMEKTSTIAQTSLNIREFIPQRILTSAQNVVMPLPSVETLVNII